MELATVAGTAMVPARRAYRIAKRGMDIGLSLLVLAFIWPLWVLIVMLVRLDSPGPAIYRRVRVGKDGRRFRMYKFRTLHWKLDDTAHRAYLRSFVNGSANASGTGKEIHKPFDESEVTRVGHFLRKSSLDELPQLINILKGEMSLVGPRPNLPWEVRAYLPRHRRRLEVLPGVTGLAQVRGRSCLTFDDIVQYDIQYIEHQSLWLDIKVLFLTPLVVLGGFGAK